MSVLAAIDRAVAASRRTSGFSITETHGRLTCIGMLDDATRPLWIDVLAGCPDWLIATCRDEIDAERPPAELTSEDTAHLIFSFDAKMGSVHLFTEEGWEIYLRNERHEFTASVIRLAFASEGFKTEAFAVEPWVDAPSQADARPRAEPDPRRFVRCVDAKLPAPAELSTWILRGSPPIAPSIAFDRWRRASCEMLALSLANELVFDASGSKVVLSGQPPKKLELGLFNGSDASPFETVSEAAKWVFGGQHDHELKHTFLTAELAREWPLTEPFCQGLAKRLPNALDSARLLYKAHVRTGSKDTLKALAELRKVLGDEVQKISQQTRDLASGVWKDVAIAVGTLSLKLLTDATRTPGFKTGIAYVGLAVAAYIGISFWMAVRTNSQFMKVTHDIRSSWRTKLYGFLDDDDYRTLATEPLRKAEDAYLSTRCWTGAVVMIIALALVLNSAWGLGWIEYRPSK
jgi:hypothetical protein